MKSSSGMPAIRVERADGRLSTSARGLWNVVLQRGPDRVVIPLGLSRSQAARLAADIGDVFMPADGQGATAVPGQLSLL